MKPCDTCQYPEKCELFGKCQRPTATEQAPDNPGEPDSSPWAVFAMNDCDWWVARSLDEAIASYFEAIGDDNQKMTDGAHELSETDLDRLQFTDPGRDQQDPVRRSFREELARRVAEGIRGPGMFASTES